MLTISAEEKAAAVEKKQREANEGDARQGARRSTEREPKREAGDAASDKDDEEAK